MTITTRKQAKSPRRPASRAVRKSRDVRGKITSHRARVTIATQLANAKEPMTLFELQMWLGPRYPLSTLSYVTTTPTKLAKMYVEAGYFARSLRLEGDLTPTLPTGAPSTASPSPQHGV